MENTRADALPEIELVHLRPRWVAREVKETGRKRQKKKTEKRKTTYGKTALGSGSSWLQRKEPNMIRRCGGKTKKKRG